MFPPCKLCLQSDFNVHLTRKKCFCSFFLLREGLYSLCTQRWSCISITSTFTSSSSELGLKAWFVFSAKAGTHDIVPVRQVFYHRSYRSGLFLYPVTKTLNLFQFHFKKLLLDFVLYPLYHWYFSVFPSQLPHLFFWNTPPVCHVLESNLFCQLVYFIFFLFYHISENYSFILNEHMKMFSVNKRARGGAVQISHKT